MVQKVATDVLSVNSDPSGAHVALIHRGSRQYALLVCTASKREINGCDFKGGL
jgi:hypothetical protein